MIFDGMRIKSILFALLDHRRWFIDENFSQEIIILFKQWNGSENIKIQHFGDKIENKTKKERIKLVLKGVLFSIIISKMNSKIYDLNLPKLNEKKCVNSTHENRLVKNRI